MKAKRVLHLVGALTGAALLAVSTGWLTVSENTQNTLENMIVAVGIALVAPPLSSWLLSSALFSGRRSRFLDALLSTAVWIIGFSGGLALLGNTYPLFFWCVPTIVILWLEYFDPFGFNNSSNPSTR